MKRLDFNDSAPRWRGVESGLNIFGRCYNKTCEAYKQEVVCPINKRVFDIIYDCDIVKCPVCKKNFNQQTCGFYECSYTWTGIKVEKNSAIKKIIVQKWTSSGKNFLHFDPHQNGMANWKLLKILTKLRDSNESLNCGVCLASLESSCKKLKCEHSFHEKCLNKIESTLEITCPLCE